NSLRFTSKSPITFTKLCSVFKGPLCPKDNFNSISYGFLLVKLKCHEMNNYSSSKHLAAKRNALAVLTTTSILPANSP
ncbi:hypothetical protein, partial [Lacticaseibacillus suibinensis]|uniref:hypothetical protein n=2 Tax=Lacticaseibacillus suibinensis TaxID=2486011 RepID=UPI0019418738